MPRTPPIAPDVSKACAGFFTVINHLQDSAAKAVIRRTMKQARARGERLAPATALRKIPMTCHEVRADPGLRICSTALDPVLVKRRSSDWETSRSGVRWEP